MRTLKFNGEYWYEDYTPIWSRIATWVVWVGGSRRHPTPVSLLGHRVTFYEWGANVRLPGGDLLVVSWCGVDPRHWWRTKPVSVYISRDGTPASAHTWLIGDPPELRLASTKPPSGSRRAFGAWRATA